MSRPRFLSICVAGTALLLGSLSVHANKAETFTNGRSWYGAPNAAAAATQVVDVKSARVVNVDCGDTVTFRNGDKSFTWRFDTVHHRAVDLHRIAPVGFASDKVTIYVSPNAYERS